MFTKSGISGVVAAALCLLAAAHAARAGEGDLVFPTEPAPIESGAGPSLVWASYLGSSYEFDYANSIHVSPPGDIVVYGGHRPTWPAPNGDLDRQNHVSRISAAGRLLSGVSVPVNVWSDYMQQALVTADGRMYVPGQANPGFSFPANPDAPPAVGYNYDCDASLVCLSPDGECEWGISFGGSDEDYAGSVAMTTDGRIFVAGYMSSRDFPLLPGTEAVFVAEVSAAGVQWTMPIGNMSSDLYTSIPALVPSPDGDLWLVCSTFDPDLPTPGGFESVFPTYGYGAAVYIAKMHDREIVLGELLRDGPERGAGRRSCGCRGQPGVHHGDLGLLQLEPPLGVRRQGDPRRRARVGTAHSGQRVHGGERRQPRRHLADRCFSGHGRRRY